MNTSKLERVRDPHWNCHSDITEPYGLIDIFDIVLMTGSYGETFTP